MKRKDDGKLLLGEHLAALEGRIRRMQGELMLAEIDGLFERIPGLRAKLRELKDAASEADARLGDYDDHEQPHAARS